MKYLFSFFIATIINISAFAQSRELIMAFDGKIGEYTITMSLKIPSSIESGIYGDYRYNKSKSNSKLELTGEYISSNEIKLEESYYDSKLRRFKVSGILKGKFDPVYNFSGTWSDSTVTKVLDLKLTPQVHSLHQDLKFEFITTSDYDLYDNNADLYQNYVLLTEILIKKNNKVIQRLQDINQYLHKDNETGEIVLADFNFDGYNDLAINYAFPGRWKNDWGQLYFLYNPNNQLFERNTELESHELVSTDYYNKRIVVSSADGSGNESEHSYKYENGHYYIIKKEYWTEEGGHTVINYKIEDDKSIEI